MFGMQQKNKKRNVFIIIAIILCIAIIPLLVGKYHIYIMNLMCVSVIIALGLNFIVGYAGQINIGQSAFVAVGAYTTGLLMGRLGLSFWIAMPAGAIFATIVGMLLSIPTLRIKGVYLALVTFGFASVVEILIITWLPLTGGADGMTIGPAYVGKYAINSDLKAFYVIFPVMLLLIYFAHNIVNKSRIGRAFVAIRDSEAASKAVGIDVSKYKVMAFMLSSLYGGIAGGLYGMLTSLISPDAFNVLQSVIYLCMIVVGGMGTILGSIIGGAFLSILPEMLRGAQEMQELFFAVVIILSIIFLPRGIAGLIKNKKTGHESGK